jgi:endonuclease YncB( thermonuclease family)
MPQGTLELAGSIDLAQYWPTGESDADTTTTLVNVTQGFRFRSSDSAPFQPTHVFEDAHMKGGGAHPKQLIHNGKVTIRLQGIDAPELHYRGDVRRAKDHKAFEAKNKNFRQPLGESSTAALGTWLHSFGSSPLAVTVTTRVDHPNDAFDAYGRLIADIVIDSSKANVNQWLAENGWAFPTFYDSMQPGEISVIRTKSASALAKKAGVWAHYSALIANLDQTIIFRPPGQHPQPDPQVEKRAVVLPKLFRRLCTFTVLGEIREPTGSFADFCSKDIVFTTEDFLKNGQKSQTKRGLNRDFGGANSNEFQDQPDGVVFSERQATIVNGAGQPILRWQPPYT